jgi:hypothetical protein
MSKVAQFFVGIDLHAIVVQICVLNAAGERGPPGHRFARLSDCRPAGLPASRRRISAIRTHRSIYRRNLELHDIHVKIQLSG